tara:strand:- start:2548 stop:3180 length:633 start_codon:yes stop_codon:yes gene_type:complete
MVVVSANCMKTMCEEVGKRGKKTKYKAPKKTKSAPKKTKKPRKTRSDKGKKRVRRTKKEVSESKMMGGEDKKAPKGRKKRSDTGKKRGKRVKKTGKGNVKMTIKKKKKPKMMKKKKMLAIKDKPMGSAEAFTKYGGYATLNVNLNPAPFIGNVAGQSSVQSIVPFVAPPRSRSNGKLTVRGAKQLTATKPKGMITRAECNKKIKQALRSR